MFGRSWRIASIGGVDIRVDSSWVVVAALFTYGFWLEFTDPIYALSDSVALVTAVLVSVLFFGSVLVHELAHAGMAKARRIPVSGITLFFFGGATSARLEDRGPIDEFLVTVVGPASSFGLAGVFWVLSHAAHGPLSFGFERLAWINAVLAAFNLVPGFPLDGGRILRAIIWRVSGNLERATWIAAGAGQMVGAALIGIGIVRTLLDEDPGALWFAFIGWMVFRSARGSVQHQQLRKALAGGVVGEAMRPPPAAIPAAMSLSEALDRHLRGHETEAFPVVEAERIIGLLTFDAAARIGRDDPLRPVRDAMLPLGTAVTVGVGDRLDQAMDRLDGGEGMVLADGRLVGTISAFDVERWLNRGSTRG